MRHGIEYKARQCVLWCAVVCYWQGMEKIRGKGKIIMISKDEQNRLSALSPSDREHFLESVAYHKEMLEELAGLPKSMQENVIKSMERNKEAFDRLKVI